MQNASFFSENFPVSLDGFPAGDRESRKQARPECFLFMTLGSTEESWRDSGRGAGVASWALSAHKEDSLCFGFSFFSDCKDPWGKCQPTIPLFYGYCQPAHMMLPVH